jgi:hypothetical protein
MFAAMRLASSFVSNFAADRRPLRTSLREEHCRFNTSYYLHEAV